ncbi:MAG: hypothetical protein HY364_02515 [Candidatus Aenigmarchaeota archaeon]|nr:hypothetical protein [Candidatus Aenigmarchaeota archaeon]
MNYIGKTAKNALELIRKPAVYTPALTLAASGLAWIGIRDMPDNYLASVTPMAVLSYGMGETARQGLKALVGRDLKWYENIGAFTVGAIGSAGLYDVWEKANTAVAQLPQDVFPSQKRMDFYNIAPIVTAGAAVIGGGKAAVKKLRDHREKGTKLQKNKDLGA